MDYALLQAVFLPLLLSPVAYVIGRKSGANAATWFTFGVLLYCTVLVILASLGGNYEEFSNKQNQESAAQTTAIIESSGLTNYVNKQSGVYFAMFLVFAMGMLGTVLATNLIEFYIFFEVMLIPAFFMIAFWGDGNKRRIALMFFFWTHVGAVILLLGFLTIGFSVGSFDFADIQEST